MHKFTVTFVHNYEFVFYRSITLLGIVPLVSFTTLKPSWFWELFKLHLTRKFILRVTIVLA